MRVGLTALEFFLTTVDYLLADLYLLWQAYTLVLSTQVSWEHGLGLLSGLLGTVDFVTGIGLA